MLRLIELFDVAAPRNTMRAALSSSSLPSLADGLAPREVELREGVREMIQPGVVELPGARVHVIALQQEQRADGTITPPAAVVVVDGLEAETVAAELDKALLAGAEVVGSYAELPGGAKVLLAGPSLISDVVVREPPAVRLARAKELRPVRPSGGGKASPEGETA